MAPLFHLIGHKGATCTQRILTVLAEKGIPESEYTIWCPDLMAGEHKKAPYTDKQPFGVIPVLEDGDFRLYESRAICRYLASKYSSQGTKLIPDASDVKARALFEQWASVELQNYDKYAEPIVDQKVFVPQKGLPVIPEIIADSTAKFSAKLEIFDKILGKQKYMGGDEFSLIDIFYLPYTQSLFNIGDGGLITVHPNVKAWWERVSGRESWKKVIAAGKA